jgi:16S rRNA (cytosine967-C5)-methyltransferase
MAPELSLGSSCFSILDSSEIFAVIAKARRASFEFLCRIELGGVFSDDVLNSREMGRLDERDRHLSTEIVYGVLRWQALLDHVLAGLCSRPWKDAERKAKILLRMSFYQMKFMDRVPDHAIVYDAVELAKGCMKKPNDSFINGVLRRLTRERTWEKRTFSESYPTWVQVSLPDWLWDRWSARFGSEIAREYALSLNQAAQSAIRLYPGCDPADPFFEDVVASDIVPGAFRWKSGKMEQSGQSHPRFHIQDEASILIPMLFGDVTGKLIWDVCAAPGGKSAILCERSGEAGLVVASDRNPGRVKRLVQTLRDYGYGNYRAVALDAKESTPMRQLFDAVLADAPCSGLGTLRRNPEIKWRFTPENFPNLQNSQIRILNCAADSVRIGGKLLYSTCSTEPEENEDVVRAFLQSHPNFRTIAPDFPPGIKSWLSSDGLMRTYPSTRPWDSFFAALMTRDS